LAGRGFRPALRHRCRGRSSGITHLFVLASSCSSCSPSRVSCATAPVVLGSRSATWISPPRSSASVRYGQNCSLSSWAWSTAVLGCKWAFIYTSAVAANAFEIDRSFQISMRKQVLRAAALATVKFHRFLAEWEQGGNLLQCSSSMLRDLTVARRRQQP
jgi:hypothetical protein